MLGAILGALGSGISAIMGSNAAKDAQKAQMAMAERNIAAQKEYAQNTIQWKTQDAMKAGIHPIYALGAPTTSFSPVSIGDSLSPGIRAAGQDISRAAHSLASGLDREVQSTAAALQLERGGLENELLRTQIARLRLGPTNPPAPNPDQPNLFGIPGQGNANQAVKVDEKTERSGWNPADPSTESHAISDIGWARSSDNTWALLPSKDAKQRLEDMEWYERQHFIRNVLQPFMSSIGDPNGFKGPFPPPPGEKWTFNPVTGRAWLIPIQGAGKWANQRTRKDW